MSSNRPVVDPKTYENYFYYKLAGNAIWVLYLSIEL